MAPPAATDAPLLHPEAGARETLLERLVGLLAPAGEHASGPQGRAGATECRGSVEGVTGGIASRRAHPLVEIERDGVVGAIGSADLGRHVFDDYLHARVVERVPGEVAEGSAAPVANPGLELGHDDFGGGGQRRERGPEGESQAEPCEQHPRRRRRCQRFGGPGSERFLGPARLTVHQDPTVEAHMEVVGAALPQLEHSIRRVGSIDDLPRTSQTRLRGRHGLLRSSAYRRPPVHASSDDHRCHASALLAAVLFAVLLWPTDVSADLAPLSPHPDDVPWPTAEWSVGPLPPDLDRATFDAKVEALFSSKGRGGFADTRALLVVQGGRIVFERYAEGFGPDSRFQSWSMAKGVTNALAGILVAQGKLALDAPAPVELWSGPDDPRSAITLRHLLQMRSGLGNSDGFEDRGDMLESFITRLLFGEGALSPGQYAADVPLVHPIGEHWAYSTGSSILVARLCGEKIGGGSVGTRDFLRAELFDRLGMRSAQPEFAASGEFIGGAFFHATARDWARFGYLYLRDGIWDGERVLPEGWVDFSRTPNPAQNNGIHGAHFWVNAEPPEGGQWKPLPGGPPTVFMAEGASFQIVAMDPTRDLVAVRLGMDQGTPFPENKEPFGPMMAAFPDRSAP